MHTAQPTGSPMYALKAISQSLGQSAVDPRRAMACMMMGANMMQAQAPSSSGGKAGGRGRAASPQSGQSSMFGSGGSQKDEGSEPDIDPADADAGMRAALAKRAVMNKNQQPRVGGALQQPTQGAPA